MALKKGVAKLIKLQIQAGQTNPVPPTDSTLDAHGVNIMEFCKAYNAATESQRGNIIPVEITVYEDRSFTFITRTPSATELVRKATGIPKGSATSHIVRMTSLTQTQVREIAKSKVSDLNANDTEVAVKVVAGTAHSMGITIET